MKNLKIGKGFRYKIKYPAPIKFPKQKTYQTPPYVLGCLLGDGCFTGDDILITQKVDLDMIERVKYEIGYDYDIIERKTDTSIQHIFRSKGYDYIKMELKAMGLLGKYMKDKFIPEEYLYSSLEDREALLQGLMDTDGSCVNSGGCEFGSTSNLLINQVQDIIRSLGGLANPYQVVDGRNINCNTYYRFKANFENDIKPFYVEKTKFIQKKIYLLLENLL